MHELELAGTDQLVGLRPPDPEHVRCGGDGDEEGVGFVASIVGDRIWQHGLRSVIGRILTMVRVSRHVGSVRSHSQRGPDADQHHADRARSAGRCPVAGLSRMPDRSAPSSLPTSETLVGALTGDAESQAYVGPRGTKPAGVSDVSTSRIPQRRGVGECGTGPTKRDLDLRSVGGLDRHAAFSLPVV